MADRPARVEITADSRSLGAQLRTAQAKLTSFAATSSRVVGRYGAASALVLGGVAKDVGAGALSLGRRLAPAVGGAAALAGGALVHAGLQVRNFEEGLIRLRIDAEATGAQIDALRSSIRSASSATGVGSAQILDGISSYVALTGDFAGATKQVQTFARVAQATGTPVRDIAATAAALQDALKIDPADMEAVFSALVVEGKRGSVNLRDLAAELAGLGPVMAQFKGGSGIEGVRLLGAAIQVINRRFNSASESATAFRQMVISLQRNADKFRSAGVNVFEVGPDGVKRMRGLRDIVDAIGASKLAKDPTLLTKAFGDSQAVAAYQQMSTLRAEMEAIAEAGKDRGAIGRDLKTYQDSPAGRFQQAKNDASEFGQDVFVRAVVGVQKTARGARIMLGYDSEAEETRRKNAEREQRETTIMWGAARRGISMTREQAGAQVTSEDSAQSTLRAGIYDWRSMDWVREQQQRVTEGNYSNKDKLLVLLEALAARIEQRDNVADLRRAVTEGVIAASGLTPAIKIGGDAVLAAVRSAPGLGRRP